MTRLTVGIVDYGIGNHGALKHFMAEEKLRCHVTDDPATLEKSDVLLLPGVGAFAPAMSALRSRSLDAFLVDQAQRGKPLLGICLGMQLLAESSREDGLTRGLGLIPGEVLPLTRPRWHIGWNTLQVLRDDPLFGPSDGKTFYFNHSYGHSGPASFHACSATAGTPIVAAVRHGNIIGVQFHPEKSQHAGRTLLRRLIDGLSRA